MSHHWPDDTRFTRIELEPEDRSCPFCGRYMHLCDHRHRKIFTMRGPVHIVSKLAHCPDKSCPGHHRTCAAEREMGIAPPWWAVGWDVFAWIAARRFARRWSVPRLRRELAEGFGIDLSEDAIEKYVKRCRALTSAGDRPPAALAGKYGGAEDLVMSIDGLQADGIEGADGDNRTLYVVCELGRKRVWFAEALAPDDAPDDAAAVRALIERAGEWAEALGLSVRAWVSDGRDVFAEGVAAVFPGVTHRTCPSYFASGLDAFAPQAVGRAKAAKAKKRREPSRAAEAYATTDGSTDDYDDPYRGEHSFADAAISSLWDSDYAA